MKSMKKFALPERIWKECGKISMVYLAVIDTNVLVSALFSKHEDAATVQVVNQIFDGKIIPLYNSDIMEEYREVLRRPKFRFPEVQIQMLLAALVQNGMQIERMESNEILPDPKDLVFYEVALSKREENSYLVTGNGKHFPVKPFIVTPNEMLEIMKMNESNVEIDAARSE